MVFIQRQTIPATAPDANISPVVFYCLAQREWKKALERKEPQWRAAALEEENITAYSNRDGHGVNQEPPRFK